MTVAGASLFYGITIAVALIAVLLSFLQKSGRTQRYLLTASFLVLLLSIGRWAYVNSEGIFSIMAARKLINLPGCWLWFIIFLFMAGYTYYRLHRTTVVLSLIINTVNTVITFFLHVKGLFYTDYAYTIRGELPYFQKSGYAPGAWLYFAAEYMYLFSALFLIIVFLVKYSKVRTSVTVMMILMIAVPGAAYAIELFAKPEVSVVPLSGAVAVILMAMMARVGRVYDMDTIVRDIAAEATDAAVIIVSDSRYYIAANNKAFELFPSLSKVVPWVDIENVDPELYGFITKKEDRLSRKDRIYEPRIRNIESKKKKIDVLWLADVTEKAKHHELMAKYRGDLEKEVALKTESLTKAEERLSLTLTQTVTALMSMVDAKDRYTSGHSFRVALYAKEISKRLGKSKAQQDTIYVTSLLHDVGKIHVPDAIINKPGRLTEDEFGVMKLHPMTGFIMLSSITTIPAILTGARWHHERYDGRGYPDGLKGEDIPEIARIIAVCDSYDAMTSRRSYRGVLPQDTARREIEMNRGRQFDPVVADVMLKMIDEDKYYNMRQHDNETMGDVLIFKDSSHHDRLCDMLSGSRLFGVREIESIDDVYELSESRSVKTALIVDMDGAASVSIEDIREKCPMLSIIAVTSSHSFDTFMRLIGEGADNCLVRPFKSDSLIETVAVLLHKNASMMSWKKGNVSAWSLGWM